LFAFSPEFSPSLLLRDLGCRERLEWVFGGWVVVSSYCSKEVAASFAQRRGVDYLLVNDSYYLYVRVFQRAAVRVFQRIVKGPVRVFQRMLND
jgi:hypothetical protein